MYPIYTLYTIYTIYTLYTLYTLYTPECASHSIDDLKAFDAIVIIGGDGLISEVIRGVGSRDETDSISLLRTDLQLAIIPGGTSNGLAKSLLWECNEAYSTVGASFQAIKGKARPMVR